MILKVKKRIQGEGDEEEEEEEVDDWTLRRFLRARDMDIEKASNMYLKYRSWRRSFIPNGWVSEAEIATDLAHNKLFMQGHDRTGRPIVVVFGARHKQAKLDDFKRTHKTFHSYSYLLPSLPASILIIPALLCIFQVSSSTLSTKYAPGQLSALSFFLSFFLSF